MPYSAVLIASAFVARSLKEGNYLTQMKLQKMVYFAHGYHLAKYGEPLVSEPVQAWKFGPVIPPIYNDYKMYGSSPITDTTYTTTTHASWEKIYASLSDSAKDAINYTWEATMPLSTSKLTSWTHLPEGPWAQVYNENDREAVIRNDKIQEYFVKFMRSVAANEQSIQ